MSRLSYRRCLFLCLAVLLPSPLLHAGPLKHPRRMVDGQTADLTPLFHWWTNHSGIRPLSAWGQASGSVVATNSIGWIVQGRFAGSGAHESSRKTEPAAGGKFILKNPPLSDRAEFDQLLANCQALSKQHDAVAAQETRLKNNVDELNRERQASGGRRSRSAAVATRNAQRADATAKAEVKTLNDQLAAARKKLAAYPDATHYEVDCLAIDLGQGFQGLPVYDYGVPLN